MCFGVTLCAYLIFLFHLWYKSKGIKCIHFFKKNLNVQKSRQRFEPNHVHLLLTLQLQLTLYLTYRRVGKKELSLWRFRDQRSSEYSGAVYDCKHIGYGFDSEKTNTVLIFLNYFTQKYEIWNKKNTEIQLLIFF